jgi:hypothetical protein
MKKWGVRLALGLYLLAFASVGPLGAGPSPDVKLLLHLVPVKKGEKATCVAHGVKTSNQIRTTGDLYPATYVAYVLIADFDTTEGVTGVQFGIGYNDTLGKGVDVISWTDCALYQWPMAEWPGAYSGNLLTWNQNLDCRRTDPLAEMKLIPRPADGIAQIAACGVKAMNAKEKTDNVKPENMGWLGFGKVEGYNPWDPAQNRREMKFTPIKPGRQKN